MPEASKTKCGAKPYGSYKVPSQVELAKRQKFEEPMSETDFLEGGDVDEPVTGTTETIRANVSYPPLRGVIPRCHPSLDACNTATNNCSGHGSCFQKYGSSDGSGQSCFSCGCRATVELVGPDGKSTSTTYWGGAACNKKDISSSFWLLAGFTVVMVGVISWGIGMLYSMGEEKLPSVIGAGVTSKSR